ncbi:hypothetical protein DFJ73DRAFT_808009 [Zopfochytrium polystomum]|nr:hypothetical protein DFJ73DRAFT_808009 [Zopfochytrium polystomum]
MSSSSTGGLGSSTSRASGSGIVSAVPPSPYHPLGLNKPRLKSTLIAPPRPVLSSRLSNSSLSKNPLSSSSSSASLNASPSSSSPSSGATNSDPTAPAPSPWSRVAKPSATDSAVAWTPATAPESTKSAHARPPGRPWASTASSLHSRNSVALQEEFPTAAEAFLKDKAKQLQHHHHPAPATPVSEPSAIPNGPTSTPSSSVAAFFDMNISSAWLDDEEMDYSHLPVFEDGVGVVPIAPEAEQDPTSQSEEAVPLALSVDSTRDRRDTRSRPRSPERSRDDSTKLKDRASPREVDVPPEDGRPLPKDDPNVSRSDDLFETNGRGALTDSHETRQGQNHTERSDFGERDDRHSNWRSSGAAPNSYDEPKFVLGGHFDASARDMYNNAERRDRSHNKFDDFRGRAQYDSRVGSDRGFRQERDLSFSERDYGRRHMHDLDRGNDRGHDRAFDRERDHAFRVRGYDDRDKERGYGFSRDRDRDDLLRDMSANWRERRVVERPYDIDSRTNEKDKRNGSRPASYHGSYKSSDGFDSLDRRRDSGRPPSEGLRRRDSFRSDFSGFDSTWSNRSVSSSREADLPGASLQSDVLPERKPPSNDDAKDVIPTPAAQADPEAGGISNPLSSSSDPANHRLEDVESGAQTLIVTDVGVHAEKKVDSLRSNDSATTGASPKSSSVEPSTRPTDKHSSTSPQMSSRPSKDALSWRRKDPLPPVSESTLPNSEISSQHGPRQVPISILQKKPALVASSVSSQSTEISLSPTNRLDLRQESASEEADAQSNARPHAAGLKLLEKNPTQISKKHSTSSLSHSDRPRPASKLRDEDFLAVMSQIRTMIGEANEDGRVSTATSPQSSTASTPIPARRRDESPTGVVPSSVLSAEEKRGVKAKGFPQRATKAERIGNWREKSALGSSSPENGQGGETALNQSTAAATTVEKGDPVEHTHAVGQSGHNTRVVTGILKPERSPSNVAPDTPIVHTNQGTPPPNAPPQDQEVYTFPFPPNAWQFQLDPNARPSPPPHQPQSNHYSLPPMLVVHPALYTIKH